MSQRISELTPLNASLPGSALVEIATPDSSSPTGFVSRSVPASAFGGQTTIPFRIPLELDITGSDFFDFEITIGNSQLDGIALRPNSETHPDDDWVLAAMLMQFNVMGALGFTNEDYPFYNNLFVINSDFFLNNVKYNDGNFLRLKNFSTSGDGQIYPMSQYQPSGSTSFNETWGAYPQSVVQDGFDANGQIRITIRLQTPYSGAPSQPVAIKLKGYVDLSAMFGPYNVPT